MTYAPHGGTHRLPGLPADLRQIYEGVSANGATGPASARDMAWLAKRLHMSKHDLEDGLQALEGKGVAGHQTAGHETLWYVRS